MPFSDRWIAAHQITLRKWALDKPLVYKGNTDTITVPRGFVTDFATVPKFLHNWIGPVGAYLLAAILHDWLLTTRKRRPTLRNQFSARDIDGLFRRVCREEGVGFVLRWMLWAGVRWGALAKPYRRQGWARDAPVVAIWSALALPIVVPLACGWLIAHAWLAVLHVIALVLRRP